MLQKLLQTCVIVGAEIRITTGNIQKITEGIIKRELECMIKRKMQFAKTL